MDNHFRLVPCDVIDVEGPCFRAGDYYLAGQLADGLDQCRTGKAHIKSVINLREPSEPGFNSVEGLILKNHGIVYSNIPITLEVSHIISFLASSMDQYDFDLQADLILLSLKEETKPLLLHCSNGERALALWSLYLHMEYGISLDEAIQFSEESGLTDQRLIQFVKNYLPEIDS
jgi:protein tyrosine phosphatase (PTP) superfamily phosphohydrolase (DUF442 family)